MLLLVDIGNTTVTMGSCEGKTIDTTRRVRTSDCADRGACSKIVDAFIHDNRLPGPSGAALCSVVPAVTPAMVEAIQKNFGIEPVIVSSGMKTGLTFSITNPDGLGADRIANAAAAHSLYGGDLAVIDFGTATTVCVITKKGEYKGGVIMPGPGISAEALAEKTAKLPRIDLAKPKTVLGDDTAAHITSGILFGQAGAVEGIVTGIEREIQRKLSVVVTGGYAELIVPFIKFDYINPLLTLEGLRILFELNAGKQH
jgi:type III pantothenate kinase